MKHGGLIITASVFASLALGLGAGYVFFADRSAHPKVIFTNPNLAQGPIRESLTIEKRQKLTSEITSFLEQKKREGKVSEGSVYFRDLNNGPWFGINEFFEFSPASLLKVPLAMAYFHAAENNPDLLTQQIEFNGPRGISVVHYPPKLPLEEQKIYSVTELITRMLQDSDNDATNILAQFLPKDQINEVYKDLGIQTVVDYDTYRISVRDYASFLRILYNSTYLSQESSEELLAMMSNSSFTQGISAGVPNNIKVVQKFGERTLDEQQGVYQLHNCGIVYAPEQPYMLCVMTQGNDYDELANVIKEVSSRVYTAVKAR